MKIRSVGTELFHAEGQKNRQKWRSQAFVIMRKRLKGP